MAEKLKCKHLGNYGNDCEHDACLHMIFTFIYVARAITDVKIDYIEQLKGQNVFSTLREDHLLHARAYNMHDESFIY